MDMFDMFATFTISIAFSILISFSIVPFYNITIVLDVVFIRQSRIFTTAGSKGKCQSKNEYHKC